jgi:hypothetical protein
MERGGPKRERLKIKEKLKFLKGCVGIHRK